MNPLDRLVSVMGSFAEALVDADPTAAVPSCPGWTVRDLAAHVGTVHRWAAAIVLCGEQVAEPRPVVTEPLEQWYAGCAAALVAALQAVEPTEETANFSGLDRTAAFWPRRQLHETTVHLVDLVQARGGVAPTIDAELAVDGVDEVLRTFFARLTGRGLRPVVVAPVRLEATDTGDVWVLGPGDGAEPPVRLARDASVEGRASGTAADLYLGLWRRVPHERLAVEGEAARSLLAGPLTS